MKEKKSVTIALGIIILVKFSTLGFPIHYLQIGRNIRRYKFGKIDLNKIGTNMKLFWNIPNDLMQIIWEDTLTLKVIWITKYFWGSPSVYKTTKDRTNFCSFSVLVPYSILNTTRHLIFLRFLLWTKTPNLFKIYFCS